MSTRSHQGVLQRLVADRTNVVDYLRFDLLESGFFFFKGHHSSHDFLERRLELLPDFIVHFLFDDLVVAAGLLQPHQFGHSFNHVFIEFFVVIFDQGIDDVVGLRLQLSLLGVLSKVEIYFVGQHLLFRQVD